MVKKKVAKKSVKKVSKKVKRVSKKVKKTKKKVSKKKIKRVSKKMSVGVVKTVKAPVRELIDERDIAMKFALKVNKKFERLVKASILFGSQAKTDGSASVGSDIDVILIVDDASINWDPELVAWYREELGKIIQMQEHGAELHVNSVRLTTWWNDLMHGDPVVINILRYGDALIDVAGFFNPLKALLLQGKIKSTPEAVSAALMRVPTHIARSRASEMGAIEGAYWAMIDSAQAMLITAGKLPPSPEHVPKMLHEVFVKQGILKSYFVKKLNELISIHKAILHGMVTNINGVEIDEWQKISEDFLKEATRIINGMLDAKD